ncbi:LysR family transcriptional regulator [Enterobacillus tribolii]|uniref:DNA-binding transcriptional LysR family regulator n=1 Tax=Enterobacillus tribolii TaxID=1487935 RepID=A0A370QVH6_9GAMM|nr:LysR family transcriptional regulator [Enterobacillus tribolii]MBW7981020.1 LysR family transcriptional regulator [Enterobacillus tribolii]RDK92923.1 DNA-binding transcriptional LysR family regulator [Enterobacillus tribolii]
MLKLRLLHYFCTVVEQGSVSAAAGVLFIAQPPLSKGLQQLEELLGVQLFFRSSKGMQPTEAGRHLYQRAGALLRQSREIEDEMKGFADGQRGVVRIGTVSMGIPRVTAMIQTLGDACPTIGFSLQQGDTQHLTELLEMYRLDAALIHLPLTSAAPDLKLLPLARSRFQTLCHPDSPLAAQPRITLAQLAGVPLALLRRKSGFGVYERVLQSFTRAGLTPRILADTSDIAPLIALVKQRAAVALLPVLPDDIPPGIVARDVPELDDVADELALLYRAPLSADSPLHRAIAFLGQTAA